MCSFVSVTQEEFEVQQTFDIASKDTAIIMLVEVAAMSEWFGNKKGDVSQP